MEHPSEPVARRPWSRITLAQMQRLKEWREAQRGGRALERQLWEIVLTVWLMGWIGWIPAFASEASWAYPLCLLGMLAPGLYVYWRARAHERRYLRCDWLDLVS